MSTEAPAPSVTTSAVKYLAQSTLTKKRYWEIIAFMKNEYGEEVGEVLGQKIQEVMKFSPDVSYYTEQMKQQTKAWRDRKKAEGISTYVSGGAKGYYHRKKAEREAAAAAAAAVCPDVAV